MGYSFDAGGPLSTIQTLDLGLLGLSFTSEIPGLPGWLRWEPEVYPVIVVRHNLLGDAVFLEDEERWVVARLIERTTTYGLGGAPLGLRLTPLRTGRLALHARSGLGAAYFARPVPAANTHHLNVTVDVGVSAGIIVSPRFEVSFGVRYHHLSNAGLGRANPGLDSKVLWVGIGREARHRE